jgi:hypothetical protein
VFEFDIIELSTHHTKVVMVPQVAEADRQCRAREVWLLGSAACVKHEGEDHDPEEGWVDGGEVSV